MDALDQMRAFVRVAEQASFTRAAQALGWPALHAETAVPVLGGAADLRRVLAERPVGQVIYLDLPVDDTDLRHRMGAEGRRFVRSAFADTDVWARLTAQYRRWLDQEP